MRNRAENRTDGKANVWVILDDLFRFLNEALKRWWGCLSLLSALVVLSSLCQMIKRKDGYYSIHPNLSLSVTVSLPEKMLAARYLLGRKKFRSFFVENLVLKKRLLYFCLSLFSEIMPTAPTWSLYSKAKKLVYKHKAPSQLFCVPFLNINE